MLSFKKSNLVGLGLITSSLLPLLLCLAIANQYGSTVS
nr:MAG TPA: hypothetical protein [Caudoviricetes sp.]